jgi:hypothetical protein
MVTERLVPRPSAPAQHDPRFPTHSLGGLYAKITADVHHCVGVPLHIAGPLWFLLRACPQVVLQGAARAAPDHLGYRSGRRGVHVDPRSALNVEDRRQTAQALGLMEADTRLVADSYVSVFVTLGCRSERAILAGRRWRVHQSLTLLSPEKSRD